MRQKDINGKYIGDSIGYCHYKKHEGALNRKLAKEHKCIAKRCRHLEKYSEDAWRLKKRYKKQRRQSMKKSVFCMAVMTIFLTFLNTNLIVNADSMADHEEKKGKATINVVDKNGECETSIETFEDVPLDILTQAEIIDACYEYSIDPKLLFAIGYVETRWQNIQSYSGKSHGIWQINPSSCRDFMWNGCDLYDPIDNALVAIQALSVWKKEFPNTRETLMAYNRGYNRSSWVPEYAQKVMDIYSRLK